MLISEDEQEIRESQEKHINMSKAELRKTHKPIMEKRRRARINHCLNEIKSLILEAMNKDPARHSKLEKADILEMAVKHLQNVQRQQLALAMASDPSVLKKFKSGFDECAVEIDRYVSQVEGVESGLKDRMRSHLQKCIGGIEQVAHFNFPAFPNIPFVSASGAFGRDASEASSAVGDQNNNARVQMPQSIQLIPSRLPSGEIALLVPNSSSLPFLPGLGQRPSAFAAVVPSSSSSAETGQRPPSPPQSPKRGFRPLQPSTSTYQEQQVPQVSSTSLLQEVKSMKFPIHTYSERKVSPRKGTEPLSIITNHSERFKQAQPREDSVDFEENRRRGVKRDLVESEGLLVLSQEYSRPSKVIKMEDGESKRREERPSTSKEGEGGSDMWRPW